MHRSPACKIKLQTQKGCAAQSRVSETFTYTASLRGLFRAELTIVNESFSITSFKKAISTLVGRTIGYVIFAKLVSVSCSLPSAMRDYKWVRCMRNAPLGEQLTMMLRSSYFYSCCQDRGGSFKEVVS